MAAPTNEERVVESVDRAWVLDGPDHPLARLTADEIRTARQIMVDADLVTETTLFPILTLDEPSKYDVLAFGTGLVRPPSDEVIYHDMSDVAVDFTLPQRCVGSHAPVAAHTEVRRFGSKS
jgi:Cu2+-containing amine oxidase